MLGAAQSNSSPPQIFPALRARGGLESWVPGAFVGVVAADVAINNIAAAAAGASVIACVPAVAFPLPFTEGEGQGL